MDMQTQVHGGDIYSAEYAYDFSTSISPIGVPEGVRAAYAEAAATLDLYPDVRCRKLKKVTITGNIKKIGKKAFYNCKKLKSIRIYSKKLTRNNVLSGAFKGISKRAVFYVPKGKRAAYKLIFLKRGAKKTMKFKTN